MHIQPCILLVNYDKVTAISSSQQMCKLGNLLSFLELIF